jgi:hypothetical protein
MAKITDVSKELPNSFFSAVFVEVVKIYRSFGETCYLLFQIWRCRSDKSYRRFCGTCCIFTISRRSYSEYDPSCDKRHNGCVLFGPNVIQFLSFLSCTAGSESSYLSDQLLPLKVFVIIILSRRKTIFILCQNGNLCLLNSGRFKYSYMNLKKCNKPTNIWIVLTEHCIRFKLAELTCNLEVSSSNIFLMLNKVPHHTMGGMRYTDPWIINFSTRRKRAVSFTLMPFYLRRKRPATYGIEGWVGTKVVIDASSSKSRTNACN